MAGEVSCLGSRGGGPPIRSPHHELSCYFPGMIGRIHKIMHSSCLKTKLLIKARVLFTAYFYINWKILLIAISMEGLYGELPESRVLDKQDVPLECEVGGDCDEEHISCKHSGIRLQCAWYVCSLFQEWIARYHIICSCEYHFYEAVSFKERYIVRRECFVEMSHCHDSVDRTTSPGTGSGRVFWKIVKHSGSGGGGPAVSLQMRNI